MASVLEEVFSSGLVGAVTGACGPDPAKDAEKETEGRAGSRRLGLPSPGVPCGLGVFEGRARWFPGSALPTQRKSQSSPKRLRASERILDPTFLLSFRLRWVSTHQRNAVRIQRARESPHPPSPPTLPPPSATLWNGLSDQGI